jgi:hypothetical protein
VTGDALLRQGRNITTASGLTFFCGQYGPALLHAEPESERHSHEGRISLRHGPIAAPLQRHDVVTDRHPLVRAVKRARAALHASQAVFARSLNVSTKLVQAGGRPASAGRAGVGPAAHRHGATRANRSDQVSS